MISQDFPKIRKRSKRRTKRAMTSDLHAQYGCGFSAPAGWRNFDASPTLRFERLPVLGKLYTKNQSRFPANVEYGDIVAGLPLPAASCAAVYASHVLEHLCLTDFRVALGNTLRLLRPNGTFRLVVPDLEASIKRYIASPDAGAAEAFLRETSLGIERRARGVRGVAEAVLGHSPHLWMWDYKALERELQQAGFVDVKRCGFGDSPDPMFSLVEAPDRFQDAVAAEAKAPPAR
jgi:SAM-dependent methyltransferase